MTWRDVSHNLFVLAHVYGRVSLQQVDVFFQVGQLLFQHGFPFYFRYRVGEHREQQELFVKFGPVGLKPLKTTRRAHSLTNQISDEKIKKLGFITEECGFDDKNEEKLYFIIVYKKTVS